MSRLCPAVTVRLLLCVAVLPWCWAAGVASGVDREGRAAAARGLVQEALHREIYALAADRSELLQQALELVPDFAPAKWHQGFVRYQNQWIPADDVPQWASRDRGLVTYGRLRSEQADTIAGHFKLANWCREQGLAEQERAHLNRVLDFSPDDPAARARLGFRWVDGRWLDEAAVREDQRRADAQRQAFADWGPRLKELLGRLEQNSELKRSAAAAAVREIRDPEAIPAMEAMLSMHSEAAALLVVDALAEMSGQEAVTSLSRHAVFAPWPTVRDAAARQLKQHKPESYVPLLLAEMYTPVTSRSGLVPTGRGTFGYRHLFWREGQEERQFVVLDTMYQRVALPGGDGRDTLQRIRLDSLGTAAGREVSAAQQNYVTALLNQRITDALNAATGQQLPAVPQRWWEWWNKENDTTLLGEKPTRAIQLARQVAVADQVSASTLGAGSSSQGSSGLAQRVECFAAGTPVWSATGTVAIERVRVGDLVLAQDVESGELAFKPVLRTTVRPVESLVDVQIGDVKFRTTRGHLFWVSGRGWVKARDLKSGMQVHAVGGGLPVINVDGEAQASETYNLVVADFHTYFAGDGRVLSHDVTSQRATSAVVPGLSER